MQIVPTWGGSMFEALMVPLFVPEETWGPRSWGVNHPLYVRGQIEHGMQEADYGYWGFSPSNNPAGGYREYGVDQLGMDGPGYTTDQERTAVDQPYEGCPGREGSPAPTAYGDGVVTPHASFLALRYARDAALENLANIREDFDSYGPGGFYDAVGGGLRHGVEALPVARPGHGDGRPGQRAGRRRHAQVRRPGRGGEDAATADARRGLREGRRRTE